MQIPGLLDTFLKRAGRVGGQPVLEARDNPNGILFLCLEREIREKIVESTLRRLVEKTPQDLVIWSTTDITSPLSPSTPKRARITYLEIDADFRDGKYGVRLALTGPEFESHRVESQFAEIIEPFTTKHRSCVLRETVKHRGKENAEVGGFDALSIADLIGAVNKGLHKGVEPIEAGHYAGRLSR